jgi:hypothetical protein
MPASDVLVDYILMVTLERWWCFSTNRWIDLLTELCAARPSGDCTIGAWWRKYDIYLRYLLSHPAVVRFQLVPYTQLLT